VEAILPLEVEVPLMEIEVDPDCKLGDSRGTLEKVVAPGKLQARAQGTGHVRAKAAAGPLAVTGGTARWMREASLPVRAPVQDGTPGLGNRGAGCLATALTRSASRSTSDPFANAPSLPSVITFCVTYPEPTLTTSPR
jgi:hypothetical protein